MLPNAVLEGLRQHTRGFPRALEAVKAILDGDDTLTPQDLLDRTRHLPGDQVVQVLIGEAFDLLDAPAQQVMQALSVFLEPVSVVGMDFLLRPVNPTTDAAPILTRLVRRQLVRFQDGHYYLHPIDRDYARSQLPARQSWRFGGRVHAGGPAGPRRGLLRPDPDTAGVLAHPG